MRTENFMRGQILCMEQGWQASDDVREHGWQSVYDSVKQLKPINQPAVVNFGRYPKS